MQGQRDSTAFRISVGAPILLCFEVMKVCDERRRSIEGYSLPFTHFLFLLSFRQFSIDECVCVCVCQCDVRADFSFCSVASSQKKNYVQRTQALPNECEERSVEQQHITSSKKYQRKTTDKKLTRHPQGICESTTDSRTKKPCTPFEYLNMGCDAMCAEWF